MKVKVEVIGDREILRAMENLSKEKSKLVKGEVYATGLDVQTEAREKLRESRTWDQGNLATSIIVDPKHGGMTADVGPEAPYAPYVEHGTRPHFPPMDALEGWAKRHGFASAWPICKAIADRGLKARPFMFPAWLAFKDLFWKRIRRILER